MAIKNKTTHVAITTRDEGIHFGTVAQVRRRGRIIHTTEPVSYGHTKAAVSKAIEWAVEHGYIFIDDGPRELGVKTR